MQFLGWFFTPVVVQRQARVVQTVQSGGAAGAVPAVVDVPGLVSPVLKTVEVPQLQYFQGGRVLVVPVLFPSAGVEKTAELPHCSRRALDKVVDMPVCATTSAHGAVQQGCGRPCDHVVGSLPQILFIAEFVGLQCAQRHGAFSWVWR